MAEASKGCMKERPILFSAPMVRALMDGSKTQTRRVAKHERAIDSGARIGWFVPKYPQAFLTDDQFVRHCCPYGQPGDRLWVREAWRTVIEADPLPPRLMTAAYRLWFEANSPHQPGFGKLRPSMFMPRWASRITLEITGVRVERLQDISEEDARAEGVLPPGMQVIMGTLRSGYRALWESINGEKSWTANPWVWVIEFRRLTA